MVIHEVLQEAITKLKKNKISDSVQKSRILLAFTIGVNKEYLVIHSDEQLDKNIINKYEEYINKLINNVPIQYITNYQEFMKLNFYVDENVLIPRADTEIVVEEVINKCKQNFRKKYNILDLCTGSGAIGISIAKYIENASVVCSDISNKALEVAKRNAKENKIQNIKFIQSDMFSNIKEKFDIIVSNPPYIKNNVILSLDKEVQKEPLIALQGGKDGLDFYRIIVNEAYKKLNEEASLFLEIGYDQKNAVMKIINNNGNYKNIYSKKDLFNKDRIVMATLKVNVKHV